MIHHSTSLVLGSGGARGLVHIGVIRCLEQRGYNVSNVAGSSIGALIGGIFAAGELDTFTEWVSALERSDVRKLLDWSVVGGALIKGERIIDTLRDLIGERDIEDLHVGFTAVATDLTGPGAGREVWLNRGPLFDAIRASIAVPTIISPVQRDGHVLVDGGIVNPVPVAPTLNNRTEVTIAVDLNSHHEETAELAPHRADTPSKYSRSIRRFLERVRQGDEDEDEKGLGYLELATRSMETMQATITQFKLAATAPSVTIRIPRNLCTFFDFHRARELIEYGYERAEDTMAEYESNVIG